MPSRLRDKLTFANVVSFLALFVALGGFAVAAAQLKKNSVGTNQLKKNAVVTSKIKNNAVTDTKLENGSVTGEKVKSGSLTGTQVNSSTLGTVPSATHAGSADSATDSAKLEGHGASEFGAVLSGQTSGVPPIPGKSTTVSRIFGPVSGVAGPTEDPAIHETLSPDISLLASHLSVRLTNGGPGAGSFVVIGLSVNGSSTGFGCQISGAQTSCTNSGSSSPIEPGSTLALEINEAAFGSAPIPGESVLTGFQLTP